LSAARPIRGEVSNASNNSGIPRVRKRLIGGKGEMHHPATLAQRKKIIPSRSSPQSLGSISLDGEELVFAVSEERRVGREHVLWVEAPGFGAEKQPGGIHSDSSRACEPSAAPFGHGNPGAEGRLKFRARAGPRNSAARGENLHGG
jgi:hypothetical protein